MVVSDKLYTAEDLWELSHLPENDGKRLILIEGAVYEMTPTGWIHGDIASELDMAIRLFVKTHKLGRVTAAETGFNLAPRTTLAPDVGFIAAARVPKQLPSGYVPFAPDLAVEVVSPGNTADEMRKKIEKYMRYGTRLLWVVYPEQQKVDVYRPIAGQEAHVDFIDIDGVLDGGDVLPGFKLPLREVF
jgi:Uma2 family endonuclease